MINTRIITPANAMYQEVSEFARREYAKKLHATTPANPDVFAYAYGRGKIFGCMGLYRATGRKSLLVETYLPRLFETISGLPSVERRQCGEIGTWTVECPEPRRSMRISIALTAELVTFAYSSGVRYVAFTTNPAVRIITDALGFRLIRVGSPDLSHKGDEFHRNWREFFGGEPSCLGFHIDSPIGCSAALEKLALSGIMSDSIQHAA